MSHLIWLQNTALIPNILKKIHVYFLAVSYLNHEIILTGSYLKEQSPCEEAKCTLATQQFPRALLKEKAQYRINISRPLALSCAR
jgi:hypothetical protein